MDRLHKAYRRAENQLTGALERRKGQVKVSTYTKTLHKQIPRMNKEISTKLSSYLGWGCKFFNVSCLMDHHKTFWQFIPFKGFMVK